MTDHKTLAEALVAAQAEMPGVKPDATNPHFRNEYVSLDHLIAKTRPVLNKHGLSLTQWATHGAGAPMLRTLLLHVSGEYRDSTMPLLGPLDTMQKVGAALTYARRYAWAAALGISADEDDDGNQASAPPHRASAAPKGGGATASAPPPPPPAESAYGQADIETLLKLVEQRGGDVARTREGAETAARLGKLDTWLPNAHKHWEAQPVASGYEKKAADAIKAAGEKQAARAAQAQADRDEGKAA